MVSKLEVRCRRAKLRHVTGNTILGGDFAGNGQTLCSRFSFHLGRLFFGRVAGEALLIVKSYVLAQRLVGIVAAPCRLCGDHPVVTLAVEDAVRLKADIVNLHAAQQTELIATAMTGGAKFLSQFITAEAGRVEDQRCSWFTLPDCPDM